ncbi:MAG: hypothetical protein ACI4QT_03005 [Kiritimatiellia bacterium]
MQNAGPDPLLPGTRKVIDDFPEYANLVRLLASAPSSQKPSIAHRVCHAIRIQDAGTNSLATGAAQTLADNPDAANVIFTLANAPGQPPRTSISIRVMDAIRQESSARPPFRTRRLFRPVAVAASIAATLLAIVRPLLVTDAPHTASPVAQLLSTQTADGSFSPETGNLAMTPAATGLAILRLLDDGLSPQAPELRAAADWLRARQFPDGSFSRDARPYNLALPALALLRLYESGAYPELFTPIDGAISSVRRRLAEPRQTAIADEACLAAALVLAERNGWSDGFNGEMRRSILRMDASQNPLYAAIQHEKTFAGKREAVLKTAERTRHGLIEKSAT